MLLPSTLSSVVRNGTAQMSLHEDCSQAQKSKAWLAQWHHPSTWPGGEQLPGRLTELSAGWGSCPLSCWIEESRVLCWHWLEKAPFMPVHSGVRDLPQAGHSMVTNSSRVSKQDGAGGGEGQRHLATLSPGSHVSPHPLCSSLKFHTS